MGRRENNVENHFKKKIKELGGISYKWVSPGNKGVPDQIAFIRGRALFVEIKTLDGKLEPEQIRQHNHLFHTARVTVTTLYGHDEIDLYIEEVKCKLKILDKMEKK